MRPLSCLSLIVILAACDGAPGTGSAPDEATRARQEAACTSAIAAHIGRPESEVEASWLSKTDRGSLVQTLDGNRRHLCEVTRSGQVLGYSHPDR